MEFIKKINKFKALQEPFLRLCNWINAEEEESKRIEQSGKGWDYLSAHLTLDRKFFHEIHNIIF